MIKVPLVAAVVSLSIFQAIETALVILHTKAPSISGYLNKTATLRCFRKQETFAHLHNSRATVVQNSSNLTHPHMTHSGGSTGV